MERIEVLKTYKIYINGQFPRTESGRYYPLNDANGKTIANVCLSSRKDFRNAVVAARGAFSGWSQRTAFNRSQILYRIAEMLEGRKVQFVEELMTQGSKKADAEKEVYASIDRMIYYAGWCDKYQQFASTVNPVSSSHFNFSVVEPMGVVSVVASENNALLSLCTLVAACIAGGNTCIVLASESKPLSAVTFSEVLATSDLPGGVVNILTGKLSELALNMAEHMDVNAFVIGRGDIDTRDMEIKASDNLKRFFKYPDQNWYNEDHETPYYVLNLQEIKTTWHPIENIGSAKAGY